jgi:hypothetical protein
MMSAMAEPDPRPAIIALLTRPTARRVVARQAGRLTASVVRGNVASADPATITFLKKRGNDERQLFAVAFNDDDGRCWFSLVAAERDAEGIWMAHSVASSCGEIPQWPSPWLNLAGQWGQGRMYAGGQIHAAGTAPGKVGLTLEDGTELEGDAEGNLVLFLAEHDAAPATVTIYDTDGYKLTTHRA